MSRQVFCGCGHLVDAVQAAVHFKISEADTVLPCLVAALLEDPVFFRPLCAVGPDPESRPGVVIIGIFNDHAGGKAFFGIYLFFQALQGPSGKRLDTECPGIDPQLRSKRVHREPTAPGGMHGFSSLSAFDDRFISRHIRIRCRDLIISVLFTDGCGYMQVSPGTHKA